MSRAEFDSHWKISKEQKCFIVGTNEQTESYQSGLGDVILINDWKSSQEIAKILIESKGPCAWIYYRPDLQYCFLYRDPLGRQSLVWAFDNNELHISPSVRPDITAEFRELPFGEVCCIDIENWSVTAYSCFDSSTKNWDEFTTIFGNANWMKGPRRDDLLTVSRNVVVSDEMDYVSELFDRLKAIVTNSIPELNEVGIAFSGGVDSLLVTHAVLASTSCKVALINVAFGDSEKACETAPDRIRATAAMSHLGSIYPPERLRFLKRNVNGDELQEIRKDRILKAAAPCDTVLDDSLACVLYMALEGKGNESVCLSPVFFVGSGADELFAGYGRHRTRFEKDGAESVAEECEAELRRYGNRNGGRDARVALLLRRQLVAPFLFDDLIGWANSLPIDAKCNLNLPRGVGEKKIIRECLRRLNAPHDAPKQAMQFGSRMAKMSNPNKNVKDFSLIDLLGGLAVGAAFAVIVLFLSIVVNFLCIRKSDEITAIERLGARINIRTGPHRMSAVKRDLSKPLTVDLT